MHPLYLISAKAVKPTTPEVQGDTYLKRRPKGRRVKHGLKRNTLKMYDPANVLRVETTINHPRECRLAFDRSAQRDRHIYPSDHFGLMTPLQAMNGQRP
jgi:hypothetical protein